MVHAGEGRKGTVTNQGWKKTFAHLTPGRLHETRYTFRIAERGEKGEDGFSVAPICVRDGMRLPSQSSQLMHIIQ